MESQLDYVIAMNNAEATHRDVWEKKEMDKKNREFAELCGAFNPNGGEVCQICGMRNCVDGISDYAADPRLVLREMKRIGKLAEFLLYIFKVLDFTNYPEDMETLVDLILNTTGKLRDLGIAFMKGVGR